MDTWRVTFLLHGKGNVAINVKSGNAHSAKQKAAMKLEQMYHVNSAGYTLVACKCTRKIFR